MHEVLDDSSSEVSSALWKKLLLTQEEGFYKAWLRLQCEGIEQAHTALLVSRSEVNAEFSCVNSWSSDKADVDVQNRSAFDLKRSDSQASATRSDVLSALYEITQECLKADKALISPYHSLSESNDSLRLTNAYVLAFPIASSQGVMAVVSVLVLVEEDEILKAIMRQLQWGSSWLVCRYWERLEKQNKDKSNQLSCRIDLLSHVISEYDYEKAMAVLLREIATYMHCELCCYGELKRNRIVISQVSNISQFNKKMNRALCLEMAMNESVDQCKSLMFPENSTNELEAYVYLAHSRLQDTWPGQCFLTIPVKVRDQYMGAFTFIRRDSKPYTREECAYAESLLAFIAPLLDEKRRNSRFFLHKIKDDILSIFGRFFGKTYLPQKLFVLSVFAVVVYASAIKGEYRLSADALLSTKVQRAVVAPFDGYISDAPYRAGDRVTKGHIIVRFDDRDLQLERLRLSAEVNEYKGQQQEAISRHDRSLVAIVQARLEQVRSKLNLVERRIARAEITSDFDGLVVSGDLSQQLGATVSKGDILFEISPLKSLRVLLNVNEKRIAEVQVGQSGSLYLSAFPNKPLSIHINKITPVTLSQNGESFFRVEADVLGGGAYLQPGMEGVGKINIDERRLIGIWSRELLEWIRLQLWTFWG